jgi:hypothetical protein
VDAPVIDPAPLARHIDDAAFEVMCSVNRVRSGAEGVLLIEGDLLTLRLCAWTNRRRGRSSRAWWSRTRGLFPEGAADSWG